MRSCGSCAAWRFRSSNFRASASGSRCAPPALAGSPWTFRRTDLDATGHVNNAAYWRVLEDLLPAPVTVEIEHRVPCGAEDVTVVAEGPRRWLVRADGTVSASFLIR